jgi:hypothetical protein
MDLPGLLGGRAALEVAVRCGQRAAGGRAGRAEVSDELRDEIVIWLPTHIPEISIYKAHQVAEVLMPLIREALAEAWDQGRRSVSLEQLPNGDVRVVAAAFTDNPYREQQ